MDYDWQAELRKLLVRPNRDLSQGGQFSIRSGGAVILRKNSNQASFIGDAQYNIDLIEIFTLRSAIDSGGASISSTGTRTDHNFAFFTAAICDFHNIPHNYKPPGAYRQNYQDAWERVVGYLEEKYSEQPRPALKNITKAAHVEAKISRNLEPLSCVIFWLFVVIWIGTIIMGHGLQGFIILAGLYIFFIIALQSAIKAVALPAHLDLPQRLARFVLRSLGNKPNPPDPSAVPGVGPPHADPPPVATTGGFEGFGDYEAGDDQADKPEPPPHPTQPLPLPDGVWLGGLDEEPPPPPTATPPGPAPRSTPGASAFQPPLTDAGAKDELETALLPVTPMARLDERQQAILREIETVVMLMDNAFQIPIIKRNVGLDPLMGMAWGLGGIASLFPAGFIIVRAAMLGIPPDKLGRMLGNVGFDTVIGVIPVAGQLSDFIIKANTANLNIIYAHFGMPPYKKRR